MHGFSKKPLTSFARLLRLVSCATPISVNPKAEQAPAPHLTHYAITRRDLSVGLQAANLIHAAGESSPGGLPSGTYAIALHARDEAHLESIAGFLQAAGIAHVVIRETDGPHAGQIMSIGIVPCDRQIVRRLLSSLPLVK